MLFEGIVTWYEVLRTWANANAGLLALLGFVVAILALLLAIQGTLRRVGRLAVAPISRGAKRLRSLTKRLIVSWRESRALAVMERNMMEKPHGFSFSIGVYDRSLAASPDTPRCTLREYFSNAPAWLNDHYVVTAVEDLVARGLLAKGARYSPNGWPPERVSYFFRYRDFITSPSVAAESERIETDSMCSVYQSFFLQQCFLGERFEYGGHRQTISYQEVHHRMQTKLKEGAPPCKRCWDLNNQRRNLSMLVVNFLENELAQEVRPFSAIKEELQGTHYISQPGPFIGAVVGHCVEAGISVDEVERCLEITRRAVAIYARHCKEQTDEQVNGEALRREINQEPEAIDG